MSATIIPAGTRVIEFEDLSAFKALNDRRVAGKLDGYVEATLEANPSVADRGILLPLGSTIFLPEFTIRAASTSVVRLWD
jgi:phage tail protein X